MTSKSIILILLLVPFFHLGNMIESQAEETHQLGNIIELEPEEVPQSDFILEDVFLGNEKLVRGSETKIWAVVKNIGNEQPNDSHVAFYVNDILFDEKSIKSKPKGYSITANTKSWEYPGGLVTIKACADPNNTTYEKNEENNCNSIQFPNIQETTAKPGSNMIVSSLSIDVNPSKIQEGVETLVTVKGNLTDKFSGIGLSGKSILVGHLKNNFKVVTDSEGFYSHTFSVTVKSGTWNVSAIFNGDITTRSSNVISTLGVVNYDPSDIEESPLELPILPDDVTTIVEPIIPNDTDFGVGISYLIEADIIKVHTLSTAEGVGEKVPEWVQTMAGWWADELTTDQEFANAIKFLLERGIVQVQA